MSELLGVGTRRSRAHHRPSGISLNGGPHRRPPRWVVALQSSLAVLLALSLALPMADLLLVRGRTQRGVVVGDATIGGKNPEALAVAVAAAAEDVGARGARFEWKGRVLRASLSELGWRPDLEATEAAALAVGRSGDLWEDARIRGLGWVRGVRIAWVYGWDLAALERVVARWGGVAANAPLEGQVWLDGLTVRTRDPEPGSGIDALGVMALASVVVEQPDAPPRPLPMAPVAPATTSQDVAEAAIELRTVLSGPIDIRLGGQPITLTPDQLALLVRTRAARSGSDATIHVSFSPAAVEALLGPYAEGAARPPQDARFVVSGTSISVEPSIPGRAFDAKLAARHLLRIARQPDRRGRVALAPVPAEFTEDEAAQLGIVEEVSSFTTYHAAGEPRVINIHLAADLLHGAIVMPGERFSMNAHLGERTPDRGFVLAPAIINGQFSQAYGGGVSQLATTLFNAAFFAGLPFHEYRAHSYYISRYPQGREATLSWGGPDLAFQNDTSGAILIATGYTDTSITVRIFGTRPAREVLATDPVVIGLGTNGYSVLVQRIIREDGKEVLREDYVTFYRYGTH